MHVNEAIYWTDTIGTVQIFAWFFDRSRVFDFLVSNVNVKIYQWICNVQFSSVMNNLVSCILYRSVVFDKKMRIGEPLHTLAFIIVFNRKRNFPKDWI